MLLRPSLHLALRGLARSSSCRCRTLVPALNPRYQVIRTLYPTSSTWIHLSSHPLLPIKAELRSGAGLKPVSATWALNSSVDTITGSQIHSYAISSGVLSFVAVSNSLLNLNSKAGLFDSAFKLFVEMPDTDIISWNTILCGFSSGYDALWFTQQMRRSGVPLDPVTFTTAISFSVDLKNIDIVQQLHSLAFNSGFNSNIFVCNALITAYFRRGNVYNARVVFDEMPIRDLVSWNALLSGLTQQGNFGAVTIGLFVRMLGADRLRPDHISVSSAIAACSQNSDLCLGRQIHCFIAKLGLHSRLSVSNVLMSMYYKHDNVDCATKIFLDMKERDVISWTTMISIYSLSAIALFNSMRIDGVQPNDVTFVALADAISPQHSIQEGEMIHGICFKVGLFTKINVSNTLITMYATLSYVHGSWKVFDEIKEKIIVTWNSLLSGYVHNGLCEEALRVFSSMTLYCEPNQYTFASVISAITAAQTVYLSFGRSCHCHIFKLGFNANEYVAGALIDMYAKRGSICESLMAFEETVNRSLISWTAIISAHAKYGSYEVVMKFFEEMLDSGIQPDHITFLSVLTACCCRGMVSMGNQIFDMMIRRFKLQPRPEHYACMVDMLGKTGRLVEAEEFLGKIPCGPGVSALHSLLGACRLHGDMEMGKRAAEALMEKAPFESGAYVLMSNIYADGGEWEKAARLRRRMRERGVKKEVAFSWVDVGISDSLNMHKFSSDDKTHPLTGQIYRVAECLWLEMRLLEE